MADDVWVVSAWQRDGTWRRILTALQAEAAGRIIRVPRRERGRPRSRPDRVLGDKAYSSRANRAYLRRRGIAATIAEPADQT